MHLQYGKGCGWLEMRLRSTYFGLWVKEKLIYALTNGLIAVKTIFTNEIQLNAYAIHLLGQSTCDAIQKENISLSSSDDILTWTKTSSGLFSLKSAWDSIKQRGVRTFFFSNLWHPNRPLKSLFSYGNWY